jgi:Fe-S cluster assembly iron-binding protein IscA
MINIQVTDEAKNELAPIIKENAKKFIRLFIQGFG